MFQQKKEVIKYGASTNVIKLAPNLYAVRKYLLSPKYYKDGLANEKHRQKIVRGVHYVLFKGAEIYEDLAEFTQAHILDDYAYPMDGYTFPTYPKDKAPFPQQIHTSRWLLGAEGKGHPINNGRGHEVWSSMRCVDAETEFLTPTGWKRIADYQECDQMMQVNAHTLEGTFINPTQYIKTPQDTMYHLKTSYGLDMVLSAEHRNVLFKQGENGLEHKVFTTLELIEKHAEIKREDYKFCKAITTNGGSGVPFSDAQLRLMVAVIADGHFYAAQHKGHPKNKSHPLWCKAKFSKERKIERFKKLLEDCNLRYTYNTCARDKSMPAHHKTQSYFCFYAPAQHKVFHEFYYNCSAHQLDIILDELPHWDGHLVASTGSYAITSASKVTIDFISYACAVRGLNSSIRTQIRPSTSGSGLMCTGHEIVYGGRRKQFEYFGYALKHINKIDNPEGFMYCFEVPNTFWLARRNGKVFVTGNTGKTLSCLWAAVAGVELNIFKKILIVSPKTVIRSTWAKELATHFPKINYTIKQGVARDRVSSTQVDIIGVDALTSITKRSLTENYSLVIYDECTAIKNTKSMRYATFYRWFEKVHTAKKTRLWVLTGTPIASNVENAYAFFKLISPHLGPRTLTAWRSMTQFKRWDGGYDNKANAPELCAAALQPSIRFELKDIIEIEDCTPVYIDVEKTPKQAKMFKQLAEQFLIDMATASSDAPITAANAAVKAAKLLQVLSGVIYGEDREIVNTDATNKLETLVDIIDQLPETQPVVIFAEWAHCIKMLKDYLTPIYKTVEVIDGSVGTGDKDTDRYAINQRILRCESKLVICQPQTAALGLDFSSTNVLVWFTPSYRAELYQQALDRVRNFASASKGYLKFFIYHLCCDPVERLVYESIASKLLTQTQLFEIIRNQIEKEFPI